MASLEDLDGDGVTDLAVGAFGDDTGGSRRGAVHVLFLNIDGTVKSSTKIAHNTNGGPNLTNGDFFGSSVASLEDLDGDGVTDLAVGAFGDDTGGTYRGAVHVLFLNSDGTVKSSTKIAHNTNGGPTLADRDYFGSSVAPLGDLDGDGVIDMAVGAFGDDTGGTYRGAVHVLFLNGNRDPTLSVANLSYTEDQNGGSPVVIDTAAMANDGDGDADWNGGSLTVQITANNEAGDEISIAQVGGITLSGANVQTGGSTTFGTIVETSGTANDGVVTNGDLLTIIFNANSTNALVQNLVRAISYRTTSDTLGTTDRTATFTVIDDNSATASDAVTISVAPTNDVPTTTNLNGDSFTYAEGDPATALDQTGNATVADVDSTDFIGGNLTVTVTSGEDATEDLLSFNGTVTLAGTVAGSNVSVGGNVVGTLGNDIAVGNDLVVNFNSADATSDNVQTMVRAITYQNTDTANPTTGARNVRVTINDGDGGTSSNADVTITITGSNDAPVITPVDVAGTILEGTTLTDSGSVTFADVDLTDLPVGTEATSSVTAVAQGGGALVLTAAQQADIEAAFSITNAAGNTNDGTVTWDYTITEAKLDFLGEGEVVTAVFTITVTDDEGATDTEDVTITITGSNDSASISGDNAGAMNENAVGDSGTMAVADLDDGENIFALQSATVGTYGTFDIDVVGSWTYTRTENLDAMNVGDELTDIFDVESADGTAREDVTITITGLNDSASISGDNAGDMDEDGAGDTGTMAVADLDDGENVFAAQTATAGTYGTFNINAAGSWTYTRTANLDAMNFGDVLTDTFNVASDDGTATEVVTITITGVNDSAAISGDNAGDMNEDAAGDSGVMAVADLDDSENIFVPQSTTVGTYGTFDISEAGSWTYTRTANLDAMNAGDVLTDTFNVASNDGTATEVVTITITGINDVPLFTVGVDQTVAEGAGVQTVVSFITGHVAGGGEGQTLSFNVNDNNSSLFSSRPAIDANGQLTYTPATNANGVAIVTVSLSDDGGSPGVDTSADQTFKITVIGVKHEPTTANLDGDSFTYTEEDPATEIDQGGNATVADVDSSGFNGGNLTVTITSGEDADEDLLSFNGTVTLAGTTAGSNVSVGGNVVGTLGNNIAVGNDLVVNFTSSEATFGNVQILMRAITYQNTETYIPTEGARNVRVTINDGDGGISPNADVTVTVKGAAENSVTLSSGNLVISNFGTALNNNFTLSFDGTAITINDTVEALDVTGVPGATGSGTNTVTVPVSSITGTQIIVNGQGGDDSLTIDFSNGDFLNATGLTLSYDGGGQTTSPDGDSIFVTGGSFTSIAYNVTGSGEGNFAFNGSQSVLFNNLGSATITSMAETTTIDIDDGVVGGSLSYELTDGGNPADGMQFLDLPGALADLTFAVPSVELIINGDVDANDSFTVTSLDSGSGPAITVNGRGGAADTVTLNADLNLGSGSATGSLNITAETIRLGTGADINTTGGATDGNVTLTATTELTMEDTSTVEAGTALVSMSATGDIRVTRITGTGGAHISTTGGNLTITDIINMGTGNLLLDVAGNVNQTATITAAGLALMVDGTTTLDAANTITTFAANNGGQTLFTNTDGVTIGIVTVNNMTVTGAVSSTEGIELCVTKGDIAITQLVQAATVVQLQAEAGIVSETGAGDVIASELGIRAFGEIVLLGVNNNVTSFAATSSAGNITFREVDGFSVSTITDGACFTEVVGVTVDGQRIMFETGGEIQLRQAANAGSGEIRLTASGDVTQNSFGIIRAANLGIVQQGTTGDVDLSVGRNDVDVLAVRNLAFGRDITFFDIDDLAIDEISTATIGNLTFTETAGLDVNAGDINVTSDGNLTVSQNIDTAHNTQTTSIDESITLISRNGNFVLADNTIISSDENTAPGVFDDVTGDQITLIAGAVGGSGNVDLGNDVEVRTDGGVAKQIVPRPSALASLGTVNDAAFVTLADAVNMRNSLESKGGKFLGTFNLIFGVNGEENLEVVIDWGVVSSTDLTASGPAGDAIATVTPNAFEFTLNDADKTIFYIDEGGKEYFIPHLYSAFDLTISANDRNGREVNTGLIGVRFSVAQHESINVWGESTPDVPAFDPLNAPDTYTVTDATGRTVAPTAAALALLSSTDTNPLRSFSQESTQLPFENLDTTPTAAPLGLAEWEFLTGPAPGYLALPPQQTPTANIPLAEAQILSAIVSEIPGDVEFSAGAASDAAVGTEVYLQIRRQFELDTDAEVVISKIRDNTFISKRQSFEDFIRDNPELTDGSGYAVWLITETGGQRIERPIVKFEITGGRPGPATEELPQTFEPYELQELEFEQPTETRPPGEIATDGLDTETSQAEPSTDGTSSVGPRPVVDKQEPFDSTAADSDELVDEDDQEEETESPAAEQAASGLLLAGLTKAARWRRQVERKQLGLHRAASVVRKMQTQLADRIDE
ncbi:MAG: VCBS domain-containing protein [Fuerstiella sp.]